MMHTNQPYILVFGVSIYDIIGFTHSTFRPNDSNPGRVKMSYGGVCRNIAENMARINLNTKFISVVGDDAQGKSMMDHAKAMNMDMSDSLVIEGESTPTYMAVLNEKGEMVSAIVDMKITDKLSMEFMDSKADIIEGAEYMVFGADNPELIEAIITKYQGKTKFILDPVSASKAKHLKHFVHLFHTVKPNRYEAEELCGFEIRTEEDVRKAGKHFRDLGIEKVFISLDSEGVYYCDEHEEGIIKSHGVDVINVTGAGDAFVGGIGHGYINGLSMKDTAKMAAAMSIITIAHEETIHPDMSFELVEQYLEKTKWTDVQF